MAAVSDKIATDTKLSGGKAPGDKVPRTERGRRTLRAILDAASVEFGDKGFHEASITGITQRAGVALGSFYTYFDSKDEVFRALVRDLSGQVAAGANDVLQSTTNALDAEYAVLAAFMGFATEHKEIYRIIEQAEFVDPDSYRQHYSGAAQRIEDRLKAGAARGEVRDDVGEIHAWAMMGMNVFLGLRFGVWQNDMSPERVAAIANDMLKHGLSPVKP